MSTGSEDPRGLILAAYAAARASGKKDWRQMTTAALKSRLLKLTGGKFDEAQYSKGGMRGFVSGFPDLVALDDHRTHPLVTLMWNGAGPSTSVAAHTVVPDVLRQTVANRGVDPTLLADLVAGKTVMLRDDWAASAATRRRLRDAMRRRARRLRCGAIDRDGRKRTLCWAEPSD